MSSLPVNQTPGTPARPHEPQGILLKDLDTPPDLARAIQQLCKHRRVTKGKEKFRIEEDYKLSYFYGGQTVLYIPTARGRLIVVAGFSGSNELRSAIAGLSPEVKAKTIADFPPEWVDPNEEADLWDGFEFSCKLPK